MARSFWTAITASRITRSFSIVLIAGCGGSTEPPGSPGPALMVTDDPPGQSVWSAPINLGDAINSVAADQGAAISKDERTLIFASTRAGGFGGNDLWISRRAHRHDPWGAAVNLGSTINTVAVESTPTLSRDEHFLYFASGRPGGIGGIDIWVSERLDIEDPLGWGDPVNLGAAINSVAADLGPTFFVDAETGTLRMYFYSTRAGGPGVRDIYSSNADDGGTFAPAALVAELSTAFEDEQPSIRRDGLEIFFASNRPGSFGSGVTDIWVSTRASTSATWREPVNLGPTINTETLQGRPAISFDGKSLYFFSDGHGGTGSTDLYMSTRRITHP